MKVFCVIQWGGGRKKGSERGKKRVLLKRKKDKWIISKAHPPLQPKSIQAAADFIHILLRLGI
jgi:hypothetical protein